MPELPEVETVVRTLRPRVLGRKILNIENSWPRHLNSLELANIQERIVGRTIVKLDRRGKYIVFGLDGFDTLIIHLKMTGQLLIQSKSSPVPDHVHTTFVLSGAEDIRFRDVRKFGRVYVVPDPSEILGELGPEPLEDDFSPDLLYKMLTNRNRIIKPLLLDQHFIAGIGNIYADESLFRARIEPRRSSSTIRRVESDRLHSGIQETLQRAIENGGATINDYRQPDGSEGEMQHRLKVYGRAGQLCLRCDGVVDRTVLGGRSTYYCSSCQR